MVFKKLIILLITTSLLTNCSVNQVNKLTNSENQLLTISDPTYKYKDTVTFEIRNSSSHPILVESTNYLSIEQYNKEYMQWDKIPYQPCKCGTPCIPPTTIRIAGQESLLITWNRESISCEYKEKITKTIKSYQKKGLYRITFVYHPILNSEKLASQELTYEFKLK